MKTINGVPVPLTLDLADPSRAARLGAGEAEAGERAMASMRFMGDAPFTDRAGFRAALAARA